MLPLTLTCHRLEQSGDSDVVAEDHRMFHKCHSAAMWGGFDVTAPGDCVSAIKPKMVFRPMVLPPISFLVGANGWRTPTEAKFQQSRRSPSEHTGGILTVAGEMVTSSTSSTLFRPLLLWYGVDCQRGQVFFSCRGEPGGSGYRSDHSYRIWRHLLFSWVRPCTL